MVRDALPNEIVRKEKAPITILKYPRDIQCIYTDILDLVPELWSQRKSVFETDGHTSDKKVSLDVMFHIGMHPDDSEYFFEKRARRGKYKYAGEDGKMLASDTFKGSPEVLFVEIDVENVVARVVERMSVRNHRALAGFI